MIDRWGNQIIVAWPAYQILWIEAAMTLPFGKRTDAYQQIADMTGRTVGSVQHQVRSLKADKRRIGAGVDAQIIRHRTIALPPRAVRTTSLIPEIRQPTKAQLMAGR